MSVNKDYTIFRIIRCFFKTIRLLIFPPKLATLNKIHSNFSYFRFWALIDEVLFTRFGKMLRPFWRCFPQIIVYRLFVLPLFLLFLFKRSLNASKSELAKNLSKSIGLSLIEQLLWMLEIVLENPGSLPDVFFKYRVYLPQNSFYAKGDIVVGHIKFVNNLASFAQRKKAYRHYSGPNIVDDKRKFFEFLNRNYFPASEIIAQFSSGKVEWIKHPICLPKQDLFVKPVNLERSIGASVVIFNQESNKYSIQKPINSFPNKYLIDGYPESPLSGEQLVWELRELSKTLPLLLEHRFHSHSSLVYLCGEDESLVTARVVTARELHGRSNLILAYLRLSDHRGGAAIPALGGIAAVIDPNSGQITRASLNDEEIRTHPFTHVKFEGFSVPFVKEAIRDCLKVHDALAKKEESSTLLLGFDIALTDTGYFFMEANSQAAVSFQKPNSPLLFDEYFTRCIQSHLNSVKNCSKIHPDPIVRWESGNR